MLESLKNYILDTKEETNIDPLLILTQNFMVHTIRSFDWMTYFIFWEYLREYKKIRTSAQMEILLKY